MSITLAGSLVSVQGFDPKEASHWYRSAMDCGAIRCSNGDAAADIIVVPDDVSPARCGTHVAIITTKTLRELVEAHRPRQLKGAVMPAPRRPDALQGYRVALFGSLRHYDMIVAAVQALGGTVAAAPDTNANLAVFGRAIEHAPQRLRAIQAVNASLRRFSEWEFFDVIEPHFVPFRPDAVQRALATRLLGLPPAPQSSYCVGF